ncbi:hypothetical protein ASPWEDRAFT_142297 [Aspergillus wentii DTO 134E9]|uniref:Uncharacterized protein n=1 Tax=Aspergillus wentii DTO 134E9 TaxID=1073089 RepID=A0A1L9R5C6_ASPWE|nr:uncharacterized protein ASPWEDRAFT_142297 [Aspergillus wentii DTO 134E9]OJJ30110.1 hypothetical protein ASPWEDRAFT_142297 [Aspergillus wentii DTO 134E9]
MSTHYLDSPPRYSTVYEESHPSYQPQPPPPSPYYHPYSSPSTPDEEHISDSQLRDEEHFVESTLQWIPPRPSYHLLRVARLQKAVLIPRIAPNSPLKPPFPFLRAYSPVLRAHDIQIVNFMEFIDNLSVAQAGSPVFSAVNAAGMAAGFIPSHWAAIAGTGMQVAAGVGTAVVSRIRTKKYLDMANERYFGPRGLRASIKNNEEVAAVVGFPKNATPLAPVNNYTGCITLCDRRMAALAPYVSLLTTDVPPSKMQTGMLDKIAAKQLEKTTQKTESKELRKHQRTQHRQEKREARAMGKQERRDRRLDKGYDDAGSYERDRHYQNYTTHQYADRSIDSDGSIEAKMDKAQRSGQRQQMKDEKKLKGMDFIVIESLI